MFLILYEVIIPYQYYQKYFRDWGWYRVVFYLLVKTAFIYAIRGCTERNFD